ncbi:MAG TPA: hypothetical protein VMV40_00650 [Acidiferrobacter sp.]|nr:hypothetical protein [Acidiferrobacter sp.]
MTQDPELQLALILNELNESSFVAHRDLNAALPAIESFGPEVTARWAQTGRDLFFHDRDAGKAFFRASAELAQITHGVEAWTEQARGFLSIRGSWKALTGYLANFPAAVHEFGVEDARRWGEIGLSWGREHRESGDILFTTPVAELSDGRGFAGAYELMGPLSDLSATRGLPPGLALPGAIKVRALLGPQAVLPWLKRGTDILKSGRLRGESFFRLEGAESDEALLAGLAGFRTSDHERFLTLFTRATLGLTPPLVGAGLRIGERPFVETDGRALFVPAAFPDREEALAAFLHHVGHLRFGTYDGGMLTRLFAAVGLAHPPLDDDQRITWRPLFAAYGDDLARFQMLFDLCEDFRIDARIQSLVPNHVPRLLALASARPPGPAGRYYDVAISSLQMIVGSAEIGGHWPALLAPDADLLVSWRCAQAWYQDTDLPSLALDERAAGYLPARSPNSQRPVYPRAPGPGEALEPEEGTGAPAGDGREKKPAPLATGHDPDMEIPPEDTAGSGGRVGVGRPQPGGWSPQRRRLRPPGEGIPYPEWDYREKAYRRDWTRILERSLVERDAACATGLLTQYAPVLRRLRRAIQSEKPHRPSPKRRQNEGEELDLDATVEHIVDRHTGSYSTPAIYRQRRPSVRDTSVLLLADLSTSIMQQAADGEGRVVDRLKAALLMFALSLEEVGDPYSIAGFASKYRDAVSYYPIKDFSQRFTAETQAILGGLSGRLATRMGAAIRHACVQFQGAGGARRLLLILSDGRPADYDDGGDSRYLHEDTRLAVKEATDQGIHAFCITLDATGAPYLERIFGRGHFLVIDTLDDLPARLPQIYMRLRKSA